MTTAPPPAYEAPPTWNNEAQEDPGPSYPALNEASAPVLDAAAAPVSAPVQNVAVKYVDQHGNPVNPPAQANVKYVDQFGVSPVSPSSSSRKFTYVATLLQETQWLRRSKPWWCSSRRPRPTYATLINLVLTTSSSLFLH